MTPEKKNKKIKFEKSINIYESFTKEEIKLLKNLNPEINILFKSSSSSKKNLKNNIYINTSNNYINSPLLVSKKLFYKLILREIQNHFIKERNNLIPKIILLLIKEITTISKIIEEYSILNKCFSHLQKRKFINLEDTKKSKVLNISLYDININKTENDVKDNIRTKSSRHYNSSFELYNRDDSKLSKGKKLNNTNLLSKNSLYGNENINIEEKIYENNTNNNNENGGIDNKIENSNKINHSINMTSIENFNSHNKNHNVLNISKISYNNITDRQKKNEIQKKYNNNNLFNKNKILIKKKLNNYINNTLKENTYKNTNKSINKRKINYNQDKNKSINKSFSNKSKNNLDDKKIISPNISIVTFLNNNSGILNKIETPDFDIFHLDQKIGKENTLSFIGYYIFNRFGFYNIINYNNFEKWCKKISEGYSRKNSYHTDLHAADITHTCLIYFKIGKVNEICKFNKASKCSLFLSCICHDYKHPGVNNNYLKETKNELSLTYNDNSILENMHISETFKLINSNEEYNIFDKVDMNIYKQIRKEMISCVLATDMTFHNFYVDFMKEQINITNNKNNDKDSKDNKDNKDNKYYQNYMNLLIHSADISNPTKPFDIYFKWAKLVVNEFYEQGDKEKELGLVCSCDRNKTTIYQSQLGFINFIEIPFFSLFADLFKKLNFYFETLNSNKNKLIEMQKEENNNKNNKDQNL
jgi:hypothetical protein